MEVETYRNYVAASGEPAACVQIVAEFAQKDAAHTAQLRQNLLERTQAGDYDACRSIVIRWGLVTKSKQTRIYRLLEAAAECGHFDSCRWFVAVYGYVDDSDVGDCADLIGALRLGSPRDDDVDMRDVSRRAPAIALRQGDARETAHTALCIAARKGFAGICAFLVTACAFACSDVLGAFRAAAAAGNLDICKLLQTSCCLGPSDVRKGGFPALRAASDNLRYDVCIWLATVFGVETDDASKYGTAVMLTVVRDDFDHFHMFEKILGADAVRVALSSDDYYPLRMAASAGRLNVCK